MKKFLYYILSMMHNPSNDKREMSTMISCLDTLDKVGFSTQFKATSLGLQSLTTERIYLPEQVKVVNFYRFEGESNPSDNAIVFAIETYNGEKGTLIDAYGPNNDIRIANFMQEVEHIEKKVVKNKSL